MKKVDPEVEQARQQTTQIWLTVYSDMVTNLMLFFLMLFAFTRLSVEVREDLFKKIEHHLAGLAQFAKPVEEKKKEEEKDKLMEKLNEIAIIQEDEKMIKIILPSPVLFDLGKAELKKEAIFALKEVASVLKEVDMPVVVEGHTCDLPIHSKEFKSNWELSAARAFSVIEYLEYLEYLVHQEGISPKRLSALGYAEFSPVTPNDSEENRAKNRRIEIRMVKK